MCREAAQLREPDAASGPVLGGRRNLTGSRTADGRQALHPEEGRTEGGRRVLERFDMDDAGGRLVRTTRAGE